MSDTSSTLVAVGPRLYEVSFDSTGLITSAQPLDAMAPSSGCSIESANQLVVEVARSSIATGIGCIGDKAAVTTGPVLTQVGPPDASIWTSIREGDEWVLTDTGTGIEGHLAFPIVPFVTWSQWPESTVPGFESSLWEPIIAIEPQPTVEAFAGAVIYVWLEEQFDDTGSLSWRADTVLRGSVCARGEAGGRELCI